MILKHFFLPAICTLCVQAACGQALPTASRLADLQVGVTFSVANSNYTNSVANPSNTNDVFNLSQPTGNSVKWHGYGAYVDLGIREHFGVELNFHQLSGSDPTLYERTFQAGLMYLHPMRFRFVPYAKAMEGRGIFNFAAVNASGQSYQLANVGYNTQSLGGGLDLRLRPGLNVRLFDYEYQIWDNFPPNKLHPQVVSFGLAYHFHGAMGLRK